MNNTFLISDVSDISLFYRNVRGKVLSTEKFSETETSLSGGFSFGVGRYYQQADIQTNMRSCVNHQIWLETENGEDDFFFYDCDIPLRENHDITITLVSLNDNDYYPAALFNHTTGEDYVTQNAQLEKILGLTNKYYKKEYYNNLQYIMEDLNGMQLDSSTNSHSIANNTKQQTKIVDNAKPIEDTTKPLNTKHTKSISGSFVINTR